MTAQLVSPQQLRQALNDYFNTDELIELCFTLGIDYENLSGDSKTEKVLELIQYCDRHGRTGDLITNIQRARPNISWELPDPVQQGPAQKVGGSGTADSSYQQVTPMGNLNEDDLSSGIPDDLFTQTSNADDDSVAAATAVPPNPFQTIATHTGTLLTERNGVRLYGLVTQQPWNLPVDAFVLPLGFGKEYSPGFFANDLEQRLQSVQADLPQEAFAQTVGAQTPGELTPTTPFILMKNSSEFWTVPGTERKAIAATANDGHGRTVPNSAAAATALVNLAVSNGLRSLTMLPLGAGSGGLSEQEVALAMVDAILAAIPPTTSGTPTLSEIIFTTTNPDVRAAMQQHFVKRPQAAVNDEPTGRDLLQVETAVYALAEMCMLNDLNPPLAVGVLGGWGSGKSFVMHLMQERIAYLRGRAATPNFPYVGHVYQIKFDAWTYAKSNLWASLMQTIFYELNAQLTREREVAKALAGINENFDPQTLTAEQESALTQALQAGGPVWEALARPDLKPRQVQDIVNFAAELDKKVQSQELLWAELRQLKETELNELRQTETELASKQAALEKARLDLREVVDKEIDEDARKAAWLPLQNAFKQQFGAVTETIKQLFTAVDPSDSPPLRQTITDSAAVWQMIRNNPTEFGAFLLLALFSGAVAWVSQNVTIQLPTLVLTFGSVGLAFLRSYDKWLALIRQSFVAYRLQVEAEKSRLADGREERIQQKLAEQSREFSQQKKSAQPAVLPEGNIPGLEQEIVALEAKAKRQRQRVGITATYVSLLDFVSSRLDEAVYEKELGLMHQVQRDLRELSESLTAEGHKLFPRGQARVVLYIDDLDRCPPLRVVEVLEAVQLLLKTDLFIVVLAIDVRFITRALETVYRGILTRRGSPSGLDYIEKIIQIPYRVRPIEEEAVAGYLAKQVVVAASATGKSAATDESTGDGFEAGDNTAVTSTQDQPGENEQEGEAGGAEQRKPEADLPVQAIEISPDEYERMQHCCRRVAMTPRAIKRLANVYKLLKIIWYREGSEPDNMHMIEVIMAMLALSERYPNQMRELFEGIAHEIRAGSSEKLAAYINNQQPENEKDTYVAQEWQQLVADTAVLSPDISLSQIDLKTFNLVRSFCFVGDIGYDPGEIVQAAARQLANSANPEAEPSPNSSENKGEG